MGTAASESFVTLENISRNFNSIIAVSDISLDIPAGIIFGLVGSDGAGKSTLLRMIATMIPPDSGKIRIAGLDVVSQKGRIKEIIGYMPQRFGLYKDLTVRENLDFFMDIFGITGKERVRRRER